MDATTKPLKKFAMIKFVVGGTNDMVPRAWLTMQNTLCSWPDKDFSSEMAMIVKNEYPPLPSWKTYRCTVLCHSGEALFHLHCKIL